MKREKKMSDTPEIKALCKAIGASDLVMTVLPKLQKASYTTLEVMTLLARAKNEYHKKLGIEDFDKAIKK